MVAILSMQYQTVYLYDVRPQGKFVTVGKVGPFCHEDDELRLLERAQLCARSPGPAQRPPAAPSVGNLATLKHRLLTYMLRRAKQQSKEDGHPRAIRHFFAQFSELVRLCMQKLQIIDDMIFLIKFTTAAAVEKPGADMSMHNAFFVVYNMRTTEILAVYENTSEELLEHILAGSDVLFRSAYDQPQPFVTAFSNNAYMMKLLRNHHYTVRHARNGGHAQAIKKVLARLPLTAQSYTASPYLDPSLFSYDEKVCAA